jgi:hypothetical protein
MRYLVIILFLVAPLFMSLNTVEKDNTILLADASLPTIELVTLKSFPTAHGFGRNAIGGRGGSVYKVTNLNASGAGSFKQGYDDNSGARTIIFEVSGNIPYAGIMFAPNDNVTIAGQTATGQGVAIYAQDNAGGISSEMNHAIYRHIRFRGSNGSRSNLRIYAASKNISNIIVDHCSFSWASNGGDEMNIEVSGLSGTYEATNVTLQYSMNGNTNKPFLIFKEGYQVSILRNWMGLSNSRGVRSNYPNDIPSTVLTFEESNNILYGWNSGSPINPSLGTKFTAFNNFYAQAASIIPVFHDEIIWGEADGTGTTANTYAAISGNINEYAPGFIYGNILGTYVYTTPYVATDYVGDNLLAAADLESNLVDYLGARWYDGRDAQDALNLSQFASRTGTISTTGTKPTLTGGTYPTDTDNDGMSDAFEDLHGLDKNNATDRNDTKLNWVFSGLANVNNTAGYTNLEMYLNFLANDFQMMINGIELPDGSFTITGANPLPQLKRYRMRIGTTIFPFFYLGSTKIYN